jgi:hypothetical protein
MRVGYSQRSLLVPAVLPLGILEYITGRRSDMLTREACAGCTLLWSVDKRSLRGAVRVRCTVMDGTCLTSSGMRDSIPPTPANPKALHNNPDNCRHVPVNLLYR